MISFDFLGWGNSDKPQNHIYNSASLYLDLEAIVKYFDFKKVSLVVHDASGPPGINWAINNPEKIDMLVLLNTYYHPMNVLLTPETIETFSTPSVKRTEVSKIILSQKTTAQKKKFSARPNSNALTMY